MVGRNCKFLRRDTDSRFVDGKERTAPEQRAIRRSIAQAKSISMRVLNFKKDGTEFWNVLSMHPVHHAATAVYCYNIGVQARFDPSASPEVHAAQDAMLGKLRALLPTTFISEAEAVRFEQAAAVDAVSLGVVSNCWPNPSTSAAPSAHPLHALPCPLRVPSTLH